MKNFNVYEKNGAFVTDSREVADVIGDRHANLLRKVDNYCKILENSKLSSLKFFIPDTYTDAQNKNQPMYHITKMGCDMVANKMTGEKGILFTATYINKFYEMEQKINTLNQPTISIADLGVIAQLWREYRLSGEKMNMPMHLTMKCLAQTLRPLGFIIPEEMIYTPTTFEQLTIFNIPMIKNQ